ncbi:MAG: type IX secretion system protein PorQ [Ignavibacteria bacterium]|nr:type IX secretion system protein PorQ [Ignavibacteria bacterium]
MKKILMFWIFLVPLILNAKESPFNFLKYTGSARSSGLGGSFVAMVDDPSALFFNPASVATNADKNFSVTFFKHVLDVNSGSVTFFKNWEKIGWFAFSGSYTNYGSFDRTDANGQYLGNFSANDFSLGFSYANILDTNLFYGGTLKFISSIIDKYSSLALAFDFGLLYLMPEDRTSIGFSILHFGKQLSTFDGVQEPLPLDVRIGVSHRLRGLPLLLNFNFYSLANHTPNFFDRFLRFSLGGEFYFGEYINLRLGYDNNIRKYSTHSKDKQLSGFSGGLGIKFKDFNFDYAISQVGVSAIFHRFSVYYDIKL